ncbi:hypothetical protein N8310_08135 [Pseudomonadota bacterium]|nr:hypothetical protein [Pseudomonadota bacterium]
MKIKYKEIILIALTGITLSSCNVIGDNKNARIETAIKNVKISTSLRSYDQCVKEGKSFDNLASSKKEEADSLYNKSAKILYDCDFLIANNSYLVNENERMKNSALSIQNYIKAGNLIQASLNFKEFQNTFNKDLTYKDGSSFIENIESLLAHNDPNITSEFALINNSKIIKSELKRINYWSKK